MNTKFSLVLVASIICIYSIFYLRIFRNLRVAHEKNKTADNKGYGKANGCKNTNSNIIPFHYLICKIDRGFKINHICTDTCQLVLSNYSLKLPYSGILTSSYCVWWGLRKLQFFSIVYWQPNNMSPGKS